MVDVQTLPMESDLYQTLECGADGKPGGILITSVGQEVSPGIWLGGYKALETKKFLQKNKISSILSVGHFKEIYAQDEFIHKVSPFLYACIPTTHSLFRLYPSQIIPKPTLYNIFLKPLSLFQKR